MSNWAAGWLAWDVPGQSAATPRESDPVVGCFDASLYAQNLAPGAQGLLVDVIDGRDKHGLLVGPEAVKDVLADLATLRKLGRGGSPVAQLRKRPRHDGQQLLAFLVRLARSGS